MKNNESGLWHWRNQRISAIVILLLTIYFIYLLKDVKYSTYSLNEYFKYYQYSFCYFIFYIVMILYHATLGVEMIIEDYVSNICYRKLLIILTKILSLTGVLLLMYLLYSI